MRKAPPECQVAWLWISDDTPRVHVPCNSERKSRAIGKKKRIETKEQTKARHAKENAKKDKNKKLKKITYFQESVYSTGRILK